MLKLFKLVKNMNIFNMTKFWELLVESLTHGKLSMENTCLFCGSDLDKDRKEAMKIRIGRLRFLLRSVENGSKTSDEILYKIIARNKELGGLELPEDDPDWWMENAREIYLESGSKK